jgi:hypothetical protein
VRDALDTLAGEPWQEHLRKKASAERELKESLPEQRIFLVDESTSWPD